MNPNHPIHPFTPVFIRLLKGPLEYLEKSNWEKLLQFKHEIQSFLPAIGLRMTLDEDDGYAFLTHNFTEEDNVGFSWIHRRALGYEESIMLILLREMMAEFETGESTNRELIRKRREIKEYAELFFKEPLSRVKFMKEIDRLIEKAEEYGFLRQEEAHEIPDEQRFRICKIIKARIGAEELDDFYQQLLQVKQQHTAIRETDELINNN
ncbi:DUF4194 domain-containing protein [Chitinophaga rhizosphaerae]|uniref:DUF4194 domain-containing protein n=1 Tax=Chitinophaga rhizosphaerae TaxID=1864947 RepID=UPI000F80BFFA|nr:DUF4194 domain-containing protein [Chitinophaga rhizosphaerae]